MVCSNELLSHVFSFHFHLLSASFLDPFFLPLRRWGRNAEFLPLDGASNFPSSLLRGYVCAYEKELFPQDTLQPSSFQ